MAAGGGENVTECVEAVRFEFLTDKEVKSYSCLKVTNPNLTDAMDRPVIGGLYDPALGPLNEGDICTSCGQRYYHCPGHCGHIDLSLPVYNPLLFNTLYNILQRTCFFCHHFMESRRQVQTCISQLELIAKGDIVGAKRLGSNSPSESLSPEDSDVSHASRSTIHSGPECNSSKVSEQQEWTSLQFTEAMSVLNNFLKPKYKKCKNCDAKNPRITKPTFGWFHLVVSSSTAKGNVIRGHKLNTPSTVEGAASSEVESTIDILGDGGDTAGTHSSNAASHGIQDTEEKTGGRKHQEAPLEFLKQKSFFSGHLLPSDARDILKRLWENEARLCSFFSNIQMDKYSAGKKAGHSIFFLETVLVPPIKFRPPSKGGDSVMEHPQTVLLNKVLESNIALANAHINNLEHSKIVNRWMDLQQSMNVLFDSKTATSRGDKVSGICQLLEKKEGLFRQKMMGKRVNFACRSVISPDPYLAVNEIGIPPYFALRLTYPEKVTPWNVDKLRNAVINGSEVHPGATHYVDKISKRTLTALNRKQRISVSRKLPSSRGVVASGKSGDYDFEGKTVLRHLQDGDVVLVNRQPTLHKPSIMAHVVRVLKGEKTLRMHYANCSTYNADFDGDEMNVHFPQDEISRSEAYNIVNANNQYVKPTKGEPIRGLIQDHLISAALLTKKDTFLCRDDFNQLLCSSGVFTAKPGSFSSKPGQKVSILNDEDQMLPLGPAILKPKPLWTGKQVITALLNHITCGNPPFTVEKEGKLPPDFFKSTHKYVSNDNVKEKKARSKLDDEEKKNKLFILKNEMVCGVIDKAQFGEYGLVHTVHELYGPNTAGILLSVMSRLFTAYLQMHGFTCGVDDLLIMRDIDDERKKQLEESIKIGEQIHCEFIGISKDVNEIIDPVELQMKIEKVVRSNGESALTNLDHRMFSALNKLTSKENGVLKHLLSEGVLKSTGKNCISLMTTSGAKGSLVNFQQISSFLGNQELEGKRVPRMVSGKTLPCFPPWDYASRAGGFIIDRFLTGLRPQEYYFHCMAGREGLVDTAVKTSRSGYLQRCLLKNLECLKICYDHTVRDGDGSIVQFSYGEDGVDVHQSGFIAEFKTLAVNQEMIYAKCCGQLDRSNSYIEKLPHALENKAEEFIDTFPLKDRLFSNLVRKEDFMKLMCQKYLLNLAQPGEPVGVLAAQSVGEPSTQMTLNTFHLAGRGEANVTLGIPRLQEILMAASKDIKTPIMTCPLYEGKSKGDAERLASKLKKITVADIIETMKVSVVPFSTHKNQSCSIYKLNMNLKIPDTCISLEECHETLEVAYMRELEDTIQNHLLLLSKISGIKNFVSDPQSKASNETDDEASGKHSGGRKGGDDDEDDDVGEEAEDLGLDAEKQKGQVIDEVDYEAGSEDEPNEDEADLAQIEDEISEDDEMEMTNAEPETPKKAPETGDEKAKSKVKGKKRTKARLVKKDSDRAVFVAAKGLHFEVHFKFTNEPHILLAQIAQRAAKKIYIQSSGKVDRCRVTNCKEDQVIYYGKDPKSRKPIPPNDKEKCHALQADGVDFEAFWQMQDDLDTRYVYSNDIHAILNMYGVEAARETIIREVKHVFGSYGISINIRHLTLIADFMTHSGGYRPMNRLGGIAESISPFSKMTFETASRFIVDAAYHGEIDRLETPSARICLGLPVKMGTGCFDLMQKVEI